MLVCTGLYWVIPVCTGIYWDTETSVLGDTGYTGIYWDILVILVGTGIRKPWYWGILGWQFLVSQLLSRGPSVGLSLAFVWARRWEALEALPPALRLRDLSELGVDLVVEVAHPCVTQEHGEDILAHADLMVTPRGHGGPGGCGRRRRAGATPCIVPRGALWGCEDIARMDSAGTLQVTLGTLGFRAQGWLSPRVAAAVASGTRTVLYEGPLRPLCPLVPNNVNTMWRQPGLRRVPGHPRCGTCVTSVVPDCHIIDVEVTAVPERGRSLTVTSTRRNPAEPGRVTGSATRHSFWSSVQGV
uniref:Uncharacterized protein n=1 Tax=Geospiza parvula TaxID=87175 RepID=A0A8C3NQV4_GEOPR